MRLHRPSHSLSLTSAADSCKPIQAGQFGLQSRGSVGSWRKRLRRPQHVPTSLSKKMQTLPSQRLHNAEATLATVVSACSTRPFLVALMLEVVGAARNSESCSYPGSPSTRAMPPDTSSMWTTRWAPTAGAQSSAGLQGATLLQGTPSKRRLHR